MQKSITIHNLSELAQAATELLQNHPNKKVFAFYGQMGAGKTTFIKEICKALGVIDNTSSPTFSIINEYKTNNGEKVFHFDFYRLKNETEAYDLGYEDYLYSNNYCFIEWPEKIENLLPEDLVKVTITVKGERREILF